jgi:hypothetical protein
MILGNFIKEYFDKVEQIQEIDEFGEKIYWFKALDVEKVLRISYLRVIIKNYNENEKTVRNTKKETGNQDTLYLSSRGLYRLLYNVKSEIGNKFRKKIGDMLDNMFFGENEEINDKEYEINEENSEENSVYDFLDEME